MYGLRFYIYLAFFKIFFNFSQQTPIIFPVPIHKGFLFNKAVFI